MAYKYITKDITIEDISKSIDYPKSLSGDLLIMHINESTPNNQKSNPIKHSIQISGIIIILVQEGEMTIYVDYKEYILKAGSLIHIMPEHTVTFMGRTNGTKAISTMISQDFIQEEPTKSMEGVHKSYPNISQYIFMKNNPYIDLDSSQIEIIMSCFSHLEKTINYKREIFHIELVRNSLFNLLIELSEIICTKANINDLNLTGKELLFEKFLNLLSRYITKEKSVNFYASTLCVSPQNLTGTLKEVSGKTTKDWIEELLLIEAKRKLKSKHFSIQEIANDLSFPDQSSFGKFFKKKVGISPSKFKTSNRN